MSPTAPHNNLKHTGLVVVSHGQQAVLDHTDKPFTCKVRKQAGTPVCGDKVYYEKLPGDEFVITEILPRTNQLNRPSPRGQNKIIAANIQQIFITCAVAPELNLRLLDRYLVAAEALHVNPIILFNKVDMLNETEIQHIQQQLNIYTIIGYTVLYTSSKQGTGMPELKQLSQKGTSIFVGQSGVGKSSLINYLLPEQSLKVSEVSTSTGKGRHTTTVAQLYHLPGGGDIIDSPGVREFGLWGIEIQDLMHGFREFRPYLERCKFRDCLHTPDSKDCAVNAASSSGAIQADRYDSYLRLLESLRQDKN